MNIYKIGNKVSCIIRFYSSPAEENRYGITEDKQPYTIINTANATLSFEDRNANSKNNFNQLSYNNSKLSTISFSDIPLNDRIIKLIFNEDEEEKYFSIAENYSSDEEGSIYLNSPTDSIYNVYIYDNTQSLLMSIEGESSKVIGGLMSVPDIIYDWSALIDEPKPSNAAHAATNHLEDVAKVATPGWKYDDYIAKGLGILGNVDDASSAADYDIFNWMNKK